MAKKAAKKATRSGALKKKASSSNSKRSGRKPAAAKSGKPSAARRGGTAPRAVGTGRGASASEIGADLVALFNAGRGEEVERKWWDRDIVSVEGMGVGLAWHGRAAVDAKNADWMSKHTVLGGAAEGPFVGSTGFAVKFRIHVRENASGREIEMSEVGVYTVSGGKIVREEFMYAAE